MIFGETYEKNCKTKKLKKCVKKDSIKILCYQNSVYSLGRVNLESHLTTDVMTMMFSVYVCLFAAVFYTSRRGNITISVLCVQLY